MHFKGFDDWIEIFRGGKQTDSGGRDHDGDEIIDRVVAAFDGGKTGVPLVIGHPDDTAPAWGWVEKVRAVVKDGLKVLEMKAKDVVPEFEDLVRKRMYPNRSISVRPDGTLRHIGFLGGVAPAVKGMAPIGFTAEDPSVVFEFSTFNQGGKAMTFKEFVEFFKFWKQVEKDPDLTNLDLPAAPGGSAPTRTGFSEADMEKAKKEAAEQAAADERKKVQAEFAEKERQASRDARKKEIADWVKAGIETRKNLAPAWVEMGIAAFMERLDADDPVRFSEKGEKQSLYAWFKAFMETIPQILPEGEIATRDKSVLTGGAAEKLATITREKMAADKTLTYSAAFAEAQRANPDLASELAASMRGGH